MKKRSPERPQMIRASFLFALSQKEPLYKMLSGGGSAGKIIMQKIHP